MKLIKNAKLYTMAEVNGEVGDILFDNGKIVEVGTFDTSKYQIDEVVDASGLIALPGIVDPHCHIGVDQAIVGPVGADYNEITNPITPELRGFDGVKDNDEAFSTALRGGVTTVCTGPGSANIIGGTFCALKTYGKTVEDKVMVEELAMKMALGENPKRCYKDKNLQTRMAAAATLREALTKARDYKEKVDEYNAKVAKGESAQKPEYNAKWASLSRVFDGLRVKIHAHQEEDILTACRISREFGLNSTIEHCTSGWKIVDKLKEYNKTVILGPTLGEKSKYELKDKSFDAGRIMYENHIPFAFMTDHPVTSLEYTRTQAAIFVAHGLPYLEGLKAITIYAAKAVGLEDVVGSLEKGKDADIVLYDGDPFHYMTKVKEVYVRGVKAYSNN